MVGVSGEHEQKVTKPIQISHRPLSNVLMAGKSHDSPLSAPTNGTCQVEVRCLG